MGSDNDSAYRGQYRPKGGLRQAAAYKLVVFSLLLMGCGIIFLYVESPNEVRSTAFQMEKNAVEFGHQVYQRGVEAEKQAENYVKSMNFHVPQYSEIQQQYEHKFLGANQPSLSTSIPKKPALSLKERIETLYKYIRIIHEDFVNTEMLGTPEETAESIYKKYVERTDKILYPMDSEYDDIEVNHSVDNPTIFVSAASYRDENCPRTMEEIFRYADKPENVYIGLVEQNCYDHCRTGVLKDGTIQDTGPDINCYNVLCSGEMGKYCTSGNVRLLRVNESESLGPAMARYFTSKLYDGETYYMQIDSHMFFMQGWDRELINMIHQTGRPKPIITNYPPPDGFRWQGTIGLRMCDAFFTQPGIESQIIRLQGSMQYDSVRPKSPKYAPFIAAGFFFTLGEFVNEVKFDPYMPWVFMGEELLLSSRAFTNGFEIFSPTINVLSHIYVRRNKPKFWESVGRTFKKPGFHNRIDAVIMRRVKNILGYPECDDELIMEELARHKELYGMGKLRPLSTYMEMVGLDPVSKGPQTKEGKEWCHKGETPIQMIEDTLYA